MPPRADVVEPGDQLATDRLDGLVEEGPDIATALLEAVEQRDTGGPVAVDEVVDERDDDLRVGQSEEIADGQFLDAIRRGGQQLVEHRLGVAHPAGGQSGDEVDRRRVGDAVVGGEDPAELAFDLGDRQAPDVEALETRQDGRRETRRLGRGEHEDHEVGRFLERLQQCVPGVARDLVRLVEDVDLPLAAGLADTAGARAGRGRRRCRGCSPRRSR